MAAYILTRPPRPIPLAEVFRSTSDPMPMISGAVRELVDAGMVERVGTRTRDGMRERGGIQLVQS